MLEEKVLAVMAEKNLKPRNVYIPLGINRVNFYQAIKTANLGNPTLQKILDFLGVKIILSLQENDPLPSF
ncbi:MAG: hypothetical protein WCJ84_03150 [Candidatus Peregrinibacteria bacterium]